MRVADAGWEPDDVGAADPRGRGESCEVRVADAGWEPDDVGAADPRGRGESCEVRVADVGWEPDDVRTPCCTTRALDPGPTPAPTLRAGEP